MMHRVTRSQASAAPPPRLVAVASGRAGVGGTTIGVNLAIALAQQGQRTVLIDADLTNADVARVCSVSATATIADVLASKRGIHEVLERGPGGIQLAAGSDSAQCRSLCSDRSMVRLMSQIEALGRHTDVVVIDAGSAPTALASRVWQAADCVLVVTTPDTAAVLDAYALIKSLATDTGRATLSLIVNQAASEIVGSDVHQRIERSCRRFIGQEIAAAGWIPVNTPTSGRLWVLEHPPTPAGVRLEQIAERLLADQPGSASEAA